MHPVERSAPEPADPPPPGPVVSDRVHALLTAHFRLVWRTLRGLGVAPGDADDAAQQVFLTLSRRLASVEPGRERAFLVQTAVRVAANHRRGRSRRREHCDDSLDSRVGTSLDPEALLDAKERRAVLTERIEQLPEDQRIVFVLFELEGCSRSEIAALLEVAPGTVASRLRRAREHFTSGLMRPASPLDPEAPP